MMIDNASKIFELNEVEIESVRRAALSRDLPFDPDRTFYSAEELSEFGMVREAYHSAELERFGIRRDEIVTCFDAVTSRARAELRIDAPFGGGCLKWQLPIDMSEGRTFITEFGGNTLVEPHVHPANSVENPGGSLRTVLMGSLMYAGREYGPGDWFYIPNGVPYSFRSAPGVVTTVMYSYAFFAVTKGNRLSSPEEIAGKVLRKMQDAA